MRTNQLLSLTDVLQRPALARWQRRFAISATHETIWRSVLDDSLRSSCRLYSFHHGVLTVAVYNATAASQLRYLNRILMQQLQSHDAFSTLTQLRSILKPPPSSPPPQSPKRSAKNALRLSQNSASHLLSVADALSDAELSKKLRDLARHSR